MQATGWVNGYCGTCMNIINRLENWTRSASSHVCCHQQLASLRCQSVIFDLVQLVIFDLVDSLTARQILNLPIHISLLHPPAAMTTPAPSGPSRLPPHLADHLPPPSTSGDSESSAQQPAAGNGLETGLLKELARTSLIESLNNVCLKTFLEAVTR